MTDTPPALVDILKPLELAAATGIPVSFDDARRLIVDAFEAGRHSAHRDVFTGPTGNLKDVTWGPGWVSRGGDTVRLNHKQEQVWRALVAKPGSVATGAALHEAMWPDETVTYNTLQVHVSKLRDLLAPLGIRVRCQRNVGYWLDITTAARQVAS